MTYLTISAEFDCELDAAVEQKLKDEIFSVMYDVLCSDQRVIDCFALSDALRVQVSVP